MYISYVAHTIDYDYYHLNDITSSADPLVTFNQSINQSIYIAP